MRQNRVFRSAMEKLFGGHLEFRVRLFNVLAMGGALTGIIMSVAGAINNVGFTNIALCLMSTVLSYALLSYSRRSGRYQVCYMVTVVAIFIVLFPLFFFSGGGYHSGMPLFFVFAVAFTIFMLEGKKAILFSAVELLLYIAICHVAYFYPDTVMAFAKESEIFADITVAFTSVSVILGACLFLHFRLYNRQQRKLDEQNILLAEASRVKTEFLQDIKHEIRSPLTAISLGADFLLDMVDGEPEARDAILTIQNEAMRLGRMINGMVELANMGDKPENRERIDFAAMLKKQSEAARFELEAKGNTLRVEIAPDLPYIYAEAEQIERVPANLLDNAARFTENGEVTLQASFEGNDITVRVCDTGAGIAPQLLPRVFERGVSGRDGNGYGLFYCKTIVEAHGGTIEINSQRTMHNAQLKSGTSVTFTIPVYGGQDIGAIHNA